MNNEETMVMQPQNNKANEQVANKSKKEEKSNTAKHVAATAAAGVFGGAVGGAGSVAAANLLNEDEPVEEVEAVVEEQEAEQEVKVDSESAELQAELHGLRQELHDVKEELHAQQVAAKETVEPDYTNNDGEDPVAGQVQAHPVSNTEESEVQVLGVYERYDEDGTHQELAMLSNGSEVAAVVDATGDGIADILAVDANHNGQFDEGEIIDISDQHVSMSSYEQEYLAQQEMEVEQNDTFAYNASDDQDYNNDVDMYEA